VTQPGKPTPSRSLTVGSAHPTPLFPPYHGQTLSYDVPGFTPEGAGCSAVPRWVTAVTPCTQAVRAFHDP